MALSDIFKRDRRPLDQEEGEGVSPIADELSGNEAVRRKQRMLLAGVAGVGLLASSFWIFSGSDSADKLDSDKAAEVAVSTKDMVNRNLSQQEWMALSENRFQATENQLKAFNKRERTNDNAVMHAVAEKMTELEMAAVAEYLSGQ